MAFRKRTETFFNQSGKKQTTAGFGGKVRILRSLPCMDNIKFLWVLLVLVEFGRFGIGLKLGRGVPALFSGSFCCIKTHIQGWYGRGLDKRSWEKPERFTHRNYSQIPGLSLLNS